METGKKRGKARGVFALVLGLILLIGFGKIFLEVLQTLIASGEGEPVTFVLVAFSFMLMGFGVALIGIGYKRLSGADQLSTRHQLSVWLLFPLGVLLLLAGGYGLLVGSVKGSIVFVVLGTLACSLAWRRRQRDRPR